MKIQPLNGWNRYTELMNEQQDPRGKAMLDNMRHHLKYECLGDSEIFRTMVPDPEYRFYASFDNAVLKGMDAVEDFYHNIWNTRSSLVELKIHRCATADWGVACDGEWYQQVPGETLIADGKEVPDPEAWYLSHAYLSWFFPFREVDGQMLLEGEICYIDDPGSTLEQLDPADVLTLEEAAASWPNG
ncbi:MAG: hypothetical protein OES38_16255 [Gammaproteobacteria bacterium]|nr:hypothetical protein [Gammaproteobacteria bacterium]